MPIQIREVAEGFGADAARYDRARPSYPDATIDAIVAASPGRSVLDVGCGTGIAARQLEAAGCTVLGVDPDARMAALAPVPVEVARFEDWDPRPHVRRDRLRADLALDRSGRGGGEDGRGAA